MLLDKRQVYGLQSMVGSIHRHLL